MKDNVQWDPLELKSLLGLNGKASDGAFQKLGKFIKVSELARKKVIRFAGALETESHVLLSGLVGMYFNGELIRLFIPGEMFMDFESYLNQIPSKYEFRAILKSKFTNLSFKDEKLVLMEIPEFKVVSETLIKRVRNENHEWFAFTQMHYEDKLRIIEQKIPDFQYTLTLAEQAKILGVSPSTASRKKNPKTDKKKIPDWVSEMEKELTYSFHSFQHPDAEELEDMTISWASYFQDILRSKEEVAIIRNQKLTYLAARLYPEADFEKALWISKLYLILFYLDDLSDKIPNGQKELFWSELFHKGMEVFDGNRTSFLPSRINTFLNAFEDLKNELIKLDKGNGDYRQLLLDELIYYFKANWGEAQNRDQNSIPSLEEYLENRPFFSGGRLAVFLAGFEMENGFKDVKDVWKKTEELRELGAHLIFLSNDLISYEKESRQDDFNNYLCLLMHHNKWKLHTARKHVLEEHKEALRKFMELDKKLKNEFKPEDNEILKILKQIKYKVAGSVYWSLKITNRYVS